MLKRKVVVALAVLGGLLANGASAASVDCSSGVLGDLRVLTVDPAKTGGVCLTSDSNLNPASFESIIAAATGLTAVHLDKDEAKDSPGANESWLSGFSESLSGSWTVSDDAWSAYSRLFLGFHFGDATGAGQAGDPDSFVVELSATDNAGTWRLGGPIGVQLNALSHIDLIGVGQGGGGGGGGGGGSVPEPASLGLVGLALAGIGLARRRRIS